MFLNRLKVEKLKEEIRKERNWFRKALAILLYHSEQQARFENTRGKKWKVSDTAEDLELSIGYVSESISLAKSLAEIPGMENLTRDNALIILKEKKGNYK